MRRKGRNRGKTLIKRPEKKGEEKINGRKNFSQENQTQKVTIPATQVKWGWLMGLGAKKQKWWEKGRYLEIHHENRELEYRKKAWNSKILILWERGYLKEGKG